MIKHVVMWKLKEHAEGADKLQNALKMISQLENLKDHIPEIVQMEAGRNMNPSAASFDVAMYSSFVTKEDLETYQTHSEHTKVVAFISKVEENRVVVDYEI